MAEKLGKITLSFVMSTKKKIFIFSFVVTDRQTNKQIHKQTNRQTKTHTKIMADSVGIKKIIGTLLIANIKISKLKNYDIPNWRLFNIRPKYQVFYLVKSVNFNGDEDT